MPVYSYHCIHSVFSENTFPKFNQGQEKSQLRWNFSKDIQRLIKKSKLNLLFIFIDTILYKLKTIVINKELTIIANSIPSTVE